MKLRLRMMIWVLTLAIIMPNGQIMAQQEITRYFAETGHSVSGLFLEKYNSASDPLKLYGYPLTDEFLAPNGSPVAGLHVQYFQRARFEYHPLDNSIQTQLAPLGKLLYELDNPGAPPLVLPDNHPACRTFEPTGMQVCYAFLNFFDNNGGVEQFGYPISNIVSVNGRLVQYFEKARFEWHPELPSQRVTLTNIGQIVFSLYEDPSYLLPAGPGIPNTILDLQVNAFPVLAVMPANGTQFIYVIVQDQQYRPIHGAQVIIELTDANGNKDTRSLLSTDERGIALLRINLKNQPLGLTEALVVVNLNSQFSKQIHTSYRVWW